MALNTPRDLLDHLIEDGDLTPEDLDEIILKFPKEGLLHEFKDGKETTDQKKAGGVVREYVSGFANSEGGVLIIGVAETEPRTISGCRQIGAEPLDIWAQKKLSDMLGYLSPLPRIKLVKHPKGDVLVIAVERAPQLVPRMESRDTKYHLRFHDSTREAPAYLITDLVLGRRKHPVLVPSFHEAQFRYEQGGPGVFWGGSLSVKLVIENQSFVFADDVECGIVGLTLCEETIPPLNGHLRSHVDVELPATPPPDPGHEHPRWQLRFVPSKATGRSGVHLAPFDTNEMRLGSFELPRQRFANPTVSRPKPMIFSCAFYILTAGSAPVWYQVDVAISETSFKWEDRRMTLPRENVSCLRLPASRPRVSVRWEGAIRVDAVAGS